MNRTAGFVLLTALCAGALGALVGSRITENPVGLGKVAAPEDRRVAEALEKLSDRVDRLALAPAMSAEGTPAPDFTALDQRLRSIEDKVDAILIAAPSRAGGAAEELTSLSDEVVLTRARSLQGQKAYDQAIGYWLSVLDRNPDDKLRAEALNGLGVGYSVVKQHVKAEEAYRKLVALHGENTEEGMTATFMLAWARFRQEHYQDGVADMEKVAASPATSEFYRNWARVNSAYFGIQDGETDRPRAVLLALKRDFGDDDSEASKRIMYQVDGLLKQLDAKE
jgi:tetratricopeptide (TPR) repeat protein